MPVDQCMFRAFIRTPEFPAKVHRHRSWIQPAHISGFDVVLVGQLWIAGGLMNAELNISIRVSPIVQARYDFIANECQILEGFSIGTPVLWSDSSVLPLEVIN